MTGIKLSTPIVQTARTTQLESLFDIPSKGESTVVLHDFPLNELKTRDWNIGMIVGPSGSGKTQTARAIFPDYWPTPQQWSPDKAVIDDLPKGYGIKELVEVLSSVGFGSPPAWLRPFHLLSNGEKFRVEIARYLLEGSDITIIDEFTSVVDRRVAQVASNSVQKVVRKRNQKLIAISCHYDIEDWLQPDWLFYPETGQFSWRCLQPRPEITLEVCRGTKEEWVKFYRHHYLSHDLSPASLITVGRIDNEPVVFCALLPLVHGTIKNDWRVSRVVVLPDYQGLGFSIKFLNLVGAGMKACGKGLRITTSHPGMIAGLNKSPNWEMKFAPKLASSSQHSLKQNKLRSTIAWDRLTSSFKFSGEPNFEMGQMLSGKSLHVLEQK